MTPPRKRSNAPIFWLMFGGGGMLAALLGTALVVITGLAGPLGIGLPAGTLGYARVLHLAQNPIGKLFLFVVVMLFAWHAVHRLFHSLHDVGIHASPASKGVCYGTALIITLVAAYSLLSVGF